MISKNFHWIHFWWLTCDQTPWSCSTLNEQYIWRCLCCGLPLNVLEWIFSFLLAFPIINLFAFFIIMMFQKKNWQNLVWPHVRGILIYMYFNHTVEKKLFLITCFCLLRVFFFEVAQRIPSIAEVESALYCLLQAPLTSWLTYSLMHKYFSKSNIRVRCSAPLWSCSHVDVLGIC